MKKALHENTAIVKDSLNRFFLWLVP